MVGELRSTASNTTLRLACACQTCPQTVEKKSAVGKMLAFPAFVWEGCFPFLTGHAPWLGEARGKDKRASCCRRKKEPPLVRIYRRGKERRDRCGALLVIRARSPRKQTPPRSGERGGSALLLFVGRRAPLRFFGALTGILIRFPKWKPRERVTQVGHSGGTLSACLVLV